MSKEKPILFSMPMVQAILAGRKTMTRRVVKPHIPGRIIKNISWGKFPGAKESNWIVNYENDITNYFGHVKPRYAVGDTLWVRETWSQLDMDYRAVSGKFSIDDFKGCPIVYKADDNPEHFKCWRPSIFMPRTAARLFLKVKNIRVERLQDITAEDAQAEGIKLNCKHDDYVCSAHPCDFKTTIACKDYFKNLWDGINAKRGYGWDLNPWVWVVEFEVQA